jgi:hypothetical protein
VFALGELYPFLAMQADTATRWASSRSVLDIRGRDRRRERVGGPQKQKWVRQLAPTEL